MISCTDIFSAPATVRWKRTASGSTRAAFTAASSRRIRQMVSSQNASNFLNITESANDDTAKVSKGEELKEISSQLKFLRQHLDASSNFHTMRKKNLDNKSFDLLSVKTSRALADSSEDFNKGRIKTLEAELEKMKKQQEDCSQDTLIYKHMLERMRQTRIHLDMKGFELTKTLRLSSLILNEEVEKKRKVRELRIQTRLATSNLETFIAREKKEKEYDVLVIEKDAKQKRETSQKREIRMRRKIEISEAAADEDRYLQAIRLRESLILHRFWHSIMHKRFSKDRSQFKSLEQAFDEVKKATNTSDTEDIIQKVLTKETNFSDIVENITYTKRKIKEFSDKNKEAEEKLALLSIVKNEINPAKVLESDLSRKIRQIEIDKERCIKLTGTLKNIQQWALRVMSSIKQLNQEDSIAQMNKLPLKLLMPKIRDKVKEILRSNSLTFPLKKKVEDFHFFVTDLEKRESPDLLRSLNATESLPNLKKPFNH